MESDCVHLIGFVRMFVCLRRIFLFCMGRSTDYRGLPGASHRVQMGPWPQGTVGGSYRMSGANSRPVRFIGYERATTHRTTAADKGAAAVLNEVYGP